MAAASACATYTINGVWPTPPDSSGWRKASIHTEHGRLLIQLLRLGKVLVSDPPTKIWTAYGDLRVVNPRTKAFYLFVDKCKKAAFSEAPTSNTMPTNASYNEGFCSDDDDDDNDTRPDPPIRMPPLRTAVTQDPLMRQGDYATRDQQISLPTQVIPGAPPLLSHEFSVLLY
jgi:hypothetical protein